jgi:hypothetical protein
VWIEVSGFTACRSDLQDGDGGQDEEAVGKLYRGENSSSVSAAIAG